VVNVNQQDQGLVDNTFLKISLADLLGWKFKEKTEEVVGVA
jgi:hypothetical protein